MPSQGKSKKIALFGMLLALSLILSYVETLIPVSFGIPGIKLGLANLIVVIGLYQISVKELYLLSISRVLLSGFIFGNMASILYSLAGGILSITVMMVLKKIDKNSVLGISMAGGVFHNLAQLIVAMILVETYQVVYYIPVLIVAGLLTGLLIGMIGREVCVRIRKVYR